MTIEKIIQRARRMGRIKDWLVLCDLCDTPASMSLALNMSWTPCAPCAFGEADSFDDQDLIVVPAGYRGTEGSLTR